MSVSVRCWTITCSDSCQCYNAEPQRDVSVSHAKQWAILVTVTCWNNGQCQSVSDVEQLVIAVSATCWTTAWCVRVTLNNERYSVTVTCWNNRRCQSVSDVEQLVMPVSITCYNNGRCQSVSDVEQLHVVTAVSARCWNNKWYLSLSHTVNMSNIHHCQLLEQWMISGSVTMLKQWVIAVSFTCRNYERY